MTKIKPCFSGKIFGGIGNCGGMSGSKALLLFGGSAASPATSIRSTGHVMESTNSIMGSSTPRLQPKGHMSPTCSEHQVLISLKSEFVKTI